jgi:hypothetical protein
MTGRQSVLSRDGASLTCILRFFTCLSGVQRGPFPERYPSTRIFPGPIEIARRHGAKPWELRAATSLARCFKRKDQSEMGCMGLTAIGGTSAGRFLASKRLAPCMGPTGNREVVGRRDLPSKRP